MTKTTMGARTGQAPSGARFTVPATPDMFVTLSSPRRWGAAELLTISLLVATFVGSLLTRYIPLAVYVAVFAFWRLSYNVGLGLLLHFQSRHRSLSARVGRLSPSGQSLVNWACARSLRGMHSWASSPAELNAWVAFRALSMVVLSNDGASYIALCMACFRPVSDSSTLTIVCSFLFGTLLIVLSVWAKAAAHTTLGDFGWYWGDFFFTISGDLTFDGVFRLVPHPMYTAGYLAYYGASLIARSHVLFAASVAAHAAQIAFLVAVEEPHIQALYGSPASSDANGDATTANGCAGRAPKEVEVEDEEEITPAPLGPLARAASAASSSHLAPTTAGLTVAVLLLLSRPGRGVLACLAVAWRLLHWVVLGSILANQSSSRVWTLRFLSRGQTAEEAFAAWRRTWLLSTLINHALFVWLALASPAPPDARWTFIPSAPAASRLSGAFGLLALSAYAEMSTWSVTGGFAFFYGDFFLPARRKTPAYAGVYRFLNHPSAALGYAAYYALALWRRSAFLAIFALFAQILHWGFVRLVEVPHMRTVYGDVRPSSEFSAAGSRLVAGVVEAVPVIGRMQDAVVRLGGRVSAAVLSRATSRGVVVRDALVRSHSKMVDAIDGEGRKKRVVEAANKFGEGVLARISSVDSDDIVVRLRKIGFTIEMIGGSEDEAGGGGEERVAKTKKNEGSVKKRGRGAKRKDAGMKKKE